MLSMLFCPTAICQQVILDGNTNSKLNTTGTTTNISTQTIKNNNAFNSFSKFNVNQNNTVNLIVPQSASNLINIVNSERSIINGTLNSLKNNQIGGNVYIVNPYGITVGSQGIINVGSLNAITSTNDFAKNFFIAPGEINETSLNVLLNKTTPINTEASVIVEGQINAIETVKIDTGSFTNTGSIKTVSSFEPYDIDSEDLVNMETIESNPKVEITESGIYISTLKEFNNSGNILATNNATGANSKIQINSSGNIDLDTNSLIKTLDDKSNIVLESSLITNDGNISASGKTGGNISVIARDKLVNTGNIEATGSEFNGGHIDLTAAEIIIDSGKIDASGKTDGGTVRLGGEFQGGKNLKNDELPNAERLSIKSDAEILANSTGTDGSGGTIIAWSDKKTVATGTFSAKPGFNSGDGGFVEISSKDNLYFDGNIQTGSGDRHGQILFDPKNIEIANDPGAPDIIDNDEYVEDPSGSVTLNALALKLLLQTPQDITLQANNDITITDEIYVDTVGIDGGNLTLQAGRSIYINNNIITSNGNLNIYANDLLANGVVDAQRDAGNAEIIMSADTTINAGTGVVDIQIRNDAAKTNHDSGNISLANVYGSLITVQNNGTTAGSNIIIQDGSIISSRQTVDGPLGDLLSDPSSASSGVIIMEADSITLNPAANILSFANNGYTSGKTLFITDDLIIDTSSGFTKIIAGDDIIVSRHTAGDLINVITPDEAYKMSATNLYIGNHLDTNYLTDESTLSSGLTYDFGSNLSITNLYLNATNAASIESATSIIIPGDLNLYSENPVGSCIAHTKNSDLTIYGDINITAVSHGNWLLAEAYINGGRIDSYGTINLNTDATDQGMLEMGISNASITQRGDINLTGIADEEVDGVYIENSVIDSNLNDINITATSLTDVTYIYINNSNLYNINDLTITSTLDSYEAISSIQNSIIMANGNVDVSTTGSSTSWMETYIEDSTINAQGNINVSCNNDSVAAGGFSQSSVVANSFLNAGGDINIIASMENDNALRTASAFVDLSNITASGSILIEATSVGNTNATAYITNNSNITAYDDLTLTALAPGAGSSTAYISNGVAVTTVNVGSLSRYLIINNDNSIDPASNISATIAPGIITVADVLDNIIALNAETVTGNATINLFSGNSQITITNESNNTLAINNLYSQVDGTFTVNTLVYGAYDNFNINDTIDLTTKQITITNNAPTNIILNEVISNNSGLVDITIPSGPYLFSDGSQLISAADINIDLGSGGIGTLANPINLETSSFASLIATAQNSIYIQSSGFTYDLAINSVSSIAGNVYITVANRSIIDSTATELANISGNNITINTPNGSVGSLIDDIDIDSNGNVTINALNIASIEELSGNLSLNDVSAGTVQIINSSGSGASDIIINPGATITGTNAGDSIVLSTANGNFINNSSAAALVDGNRWVVYSSDPGHTLENGLVYEKYYNQTYLTMPPSSTPLDTSNYIIYNYNAILNVLAEDQTKTYGDVNPPFAYNISGYIDGDIYVSTVSGIPAISSIADTNSPIGIYAIIPEEGTLTTNKGYLFNFLNGNLTINPADLTIQADNSAKIYGAALPAFSSTFTGLVAGDVPADYAVTYNTAADANSNVGNYSVTPSGVIDTNYNITFTGGILTINPADLTIQADNSAKIYGAALPAFSSTFTGLVAGDVPADYAVTYNTAADANSNVGNYAVTPSGVIDTNYNITFTDGILTINPADLTIQADNSAKIYGAALPAFSSTFTGLVAGDVPADYAVTYNTAADTNSNVGNYAVTPSGVIDTNYNITFTGGILTINPADLTIQADNSAKIYGAALPAFSSTFTGLVAGDVPADYAVTYNTAADANSNVGNYAVTPSGVIDANYNITFNDGILTINPADLTIQADNSAKIYGAALPAFSSTFTGLVAGDVPADYAVTYNTAADANSNVGNYAVTPSGVIDTNYNITFNDGILTINPADLTIQADNSAKIYGAALPAFSSTFTGLVAGDVSADYAVTYNTAADTNSNIGNYAVTPSGVIDTNYNITFTGGILTINPADLTIQADNSAKIYGATLPAFSSTFTGLVAGDVSADYAVTYNTAADANSNVGNYAVTPSSVIDANYNITFTGGILTINPADLTIQADNSAKIYGAALPAFSSTFTGLVAGDVPADYAVTYNTAADANSNIGNYAVTPSGVIDTNYNITFNDGILTINPADLTIQADNSAKIYGATLPAFSSTFTGLVAGDVSADYAVTYNTAADANSNVGNYAVTPSGVIDTNYNITFTGGILTINPVDLTIQADNSAKIYGATLPAFSSTFTGLVEGDVPADYAVTYNTAADANSNVGNYAVTPSGVIDTNYNITFTGGILTINPADLTIQADNSAKIYGAALPAFSSTFNGLVAGDVPADYDITYNTAADANSNVGNYVVTPSGVIDANYNITFNDGILTINPADLTIQADNSAKIYGATLPAFSSTFTGLVAGDVPADYAVTYNTAADANSNVGNYAVTPSGVIDTNYNITFTGGILTINPVDLTIQADNSAKIYGATLPAFSSTFTGLVAGDVPADYAVTYNTAADANSNVGNYAVTPSGIIDTNYNITFIDGNLAVNPAVLYISANNSSKDYQHENPNFSASYNGFVLDENAANLNGELTFATDATTYSLPGSYTVTPSGQTSTNYNINYLDGILLVNAIEQVDEPNLPANTPVAEPVLEPKADTLITTQEIEVLVEDLESTVIQETEVIINTIFSGTNNITNESNTESNIINTGPNYNFNNTNTTNPELTNDSILTLMPEYREDSIISEQHNNNGNIGNTFETSNDTILSFNNTNSDTAPTESTLISSNSNNSTGINNIKEESTSETSKSTATGEPLEVNTEDIIDDTDMEEFSDDQEESNNKVANNDSGINWSSTKQTNDNKTISDSSSDPQIMETIFKVCKGKDSCKDIETSVNISLMQQSLLYVSEEKELDADEMGTNYLAKAGYHPSGLKGYLLTISFIEQKVKNKQQSTNNVTGFFYRHPETPVRIKQVNKTIAKHNLRNNEQKHLNSYVYNSLLEEADLTIKNNKIKRVIDNLHQNTSDKEYFDSN